MKGAFRTLIVMVKIEMTHKSVKLAMNMMEVLAVGEKMCRSMFEVMS
jgi:hypothetical protein